MIGVRLISDAVIRVLHGIQMRFPLGIFGVRRARIDGFRAFSLSETRVPSGESTWFHASSMGELEMLAPMIEDFLLAGQEVAVSVFSDSALPALKKLPAKCIYAGLSPPEGAWASCFKQLRVKKLILAKYDFWPGMMVSALRQGAPVVVINAGVRPSMRWIQWIPEIRRAIQSQDRLILFDSGSTALTPSGFRAGVDPRWERVSRRMLAAKASDALISSNEWIREALAKAQRPLGVLGSAWAEDVEVLLPALAGTSASLWVVPHSLEPANLERIRRLIPSGLSDRVMMIEKMGILVELYGLADFAFVGGGFGKGIHSTLEPAAHGLPVACGPAQVEAFAETGELRSRGILMVCQNSEDCARWLAALRPKDPHPEFISRKQHQYRALLEECLRIR